MKLKQLLTENISVSNLDKQYFTLIKQVWENWKSKYPDEDGIDNPDYMFNEIERSALMYDIDWVSMIQSMKSSSSISRNTKPCSKIAKACYYNSLDYIIKYDSEKINLAWGIAVELPELMNDISNGLRDSNSNYIGKLPSFITLHAFLVTNDNKIIDPTWGMSGRGQVYFYEIVPKDVWKKFSHKEDDKENFDARDFADEYISKVAGKKYDIKKLQDKWLVFAKKK